MLDIETVSLHSLREDIVFIGEQCYKILIIRGRKVWKNQWGIP